MALSFSHETNIISVLSPQTTLTMQELADAIADFEAEPVSMGYPDIAIIEGKVDKGGGKFSEIIVKLFPPWQVQFWSGSGVTTIDGGSLVRTDAGVPFAATGAAGDITVLSLPVDGTLQQTPAPGIPDAQATKLDELHEVYGLNASNPVTHEKEPEKIVSTNIDIDVTEDQDGNVTVQRN